MNRASVAVALLLCGVCYNSGVSSSEPVQLETLQLPIAAKIGDQFPANQVQHFIIVNNDLLLVVHERDSALKLGRDVFSQVTGYGPGDTLHDVCRAFSQSAEDETDSPVEACDAVRVRFFITSSQQVGCVFRHRNKHGCEFTCAACWFVSKESATLAVRLILKWLDQFFISEVTHGCDASIKVPVFYGTRNSITITLPQKQRLLLSERCTNEVRRTVLYRTAIGAPIRKLDTVGHVHYMVPTFQNPLSRPLHAQNDVEKAGAWKTIADSFKYAIFGPSATMG
jgi:hypothetical protein